MLSRHFDSFRLTLTLATLALTLGVLAACGGGEPVQEAAVEAEQAALAPSDAMETDAEVGTARVFFANVSDGDEVTSPVSLEFGIEHFEIVAAQSPAVIEEGRGHHHLGVNTDCLPVGVVIEKAEPWIHFGDGSMTIDMQLPPGPARLTLQVGDGEHRTLEGDGLCTTIELMVIEGEVVE